MTQAAAAAMHDRPAPDPGVATATRSTDTLDERLARKLAAARKHRNTIRYVESHRWLLSSDEHRREAGNALTRARIGLGRLTKTIQALRAAIRERDERRRASLPPKAAICRVFGGYCREAVAVAWCESRLVTSARNGQYLGIFQMGSDARRLFGHGPTAHEQAAAAHRYFVRSGRDWSPWGCKPGYAP